MSTTRFLYCPSQSIMRVRARLWKMERTEIDNPYAAPTVSTVADADWYGIPEGGFRVYEDRLMVRGDLKLPAVCLQTGQTENLVTQRTTAWHLTWFGDLVETGLGMIALGCVFSSIMIGIQYGRHLLYPFGVTLTPAAFCFAAYGLMQRTLKNWTSVPVRVVWYINRDVLASREQRRRRRNAILLSGCAVATLATWWLFDSILAVPVLVVAMAFWLNHRKNTVAKFSNGIYFLTGFEVAHIKRLSSVTRFSDDRFSV